MLDLNDIPPELGGGPLELAQRHADSRGLAGDSYKAHARERLQILREDYRGQIAAVLDFQHYDAAVRARLRKHVTQVFNVGADVTRALACVYKNGARRSVGTRRGDETIAALNEATHFGTLAPELNRLGWFVGPTLEIPRVRGSRLVREIITPDRYDVLLDPDDPLGPPIAAAWTWPFRGMQAIVVATLEAFLYFDPMKLDEPIAVEPHGLTDPDGEPIFPGTIWRFDVPTDPHDYFCKRRHSRVVQATQEVGAIASIMSWVRKSQNRNIIGLFGNLEKLASDAKADPEKGFAMQYDDGDALPKLQVENLDTPIENFAAHIMLLYRTVIEAFGIPQSAVTFDFSQDQSTLGGLELQHERLSQLRNDQIPFARESEKSSQYRLAETARAHKHSLAAGLPSQQRVWDMEIEFPELNRVEDPTRLKQLTEWELQRGQTTDAHLYQRRHPHLTLDECRAAVRAHLEEQAEINDMKASRRLDPAAPMESEPERTGRIGGSAIPNPNPEP